MKTLLKHTLIIQLFLIVFLFQTSSAQNFELVPEESTLIINGTSNLHDWTITSSSCTGTISFNDINKCSINSLKFEVPPISLKSGKKGMDKNTYKALKTDEFKNIKFLLTEVTTLNNSNPNNYSIEVEGVLSIMENNKKILLKNNILLNNNNVCIEGSKKIKMTDFGVEPPKALFGTITTGDEITIDYKLIFKTI
ncbi:YceI family protein [Hyunsoonleella aestuarii]|uniref:Lipid/polyisoprenoid-binding YceI-like domain-containing protein n=1 Tax=Hyunsoonleella aestuarii TaxID=912802 RepID=A0ABP8E784_9FLAO|nr:YceI family protein [Hyunsoonleella aestuarii]